MNELFVLTVRSSKWLASQFVALDVFTFCWNSL